jgi:uncharacterized delta-60 repeat protein
MIGIVMKALRISVAGILLVASGAVAGIAPGDVDTEFNTGGISPPAFCFINAILERPGGKLLIGGQFYAVGGIFRTNLAQLQSNGSLDTLFLKDIPGPVGGVNSLANYPGDRIVVGGRFDSISGVRRAKLARLNPDGSLDNSFLSGMAGPNELVEKALVQPDGKILIQGSFTTVNGVEKLGLAGLNEDGSVDLAFAPVFASMNSSGGSPQPVSVGSVLLLSDAKIMVGGRFQEVNGAPCTNFARLNPDGTLDTTFVPRLTVPSADVYECIGVLPGNRLLCRGDYYVYYEGGGQYPVYPIHRLGEDGVEDPEFQKPGIPTDPGWVSGMVVLENGGFLIGGAFRPVHAPVPLGCAHFAAFHEDGSFDSSFLNGQSGPGYGGPVTSVMKQTDGKVLLGGFFTAFNGIQSLGLVRLIGDCKTLHIIEDPASQTAEIGADVTFRVKAAGYPAPVYRWHFRGQAMNAEIGTNAALRLTAVQPEAVGDYCAVLMNTLPPLTSAPAMLNVITPVERRVVPRIQLAAQPGTEWRIETTEVLSWTWSGIETLSLVTATGHVFDLTAPIPSQRFYRARQSSGTVAEAVLGIQLIPEIMLRGSPGSRLMVDYINAVGPTDAWATLDTVTLTNTAQIYLDTSAPGQARRLYRVTPVP